MQKHFINFLLFSLGLLLAVGFVRYSSWLKTSRLPVSVSLQGVEIPTTRSNSITLNKQRLAKRLRGVAPERRIKMLEMALRDESLSSLDMLKSDELRALPSYRSTILNRLKLVTFEVLLQRFIEADWRTWPIGSLDQNRKPTKARQLVDALWEVNNDLASFAETTAYLLHSMFSAIAGGRTYPIRQDLQYLVMNTEQMLSARRSAANIRESAFDASILQNPSVYLSFEKVRGELTKQFIREHPFQRESHFNLLLDLDPRVFDESLRLKVKDSLENLSLNASSDYRAEILPAVVESRLFSLLAAQDSGVAHSLAQLYLVGSVDAIEAGRLELAQRLLLRSESTYGGLEAQKVLSTFIAEQAAAAKRSVKPPAKKDRSLKNVVKPKRILETSTEDNSTGWASIFLLAILGIAAFYGFRIFMERRATTRISGAVAKSSEASQATAARSVVSDPGELEFSSDPLDADIDFDFSQAANR